MPSKLLSDMSRGIEEQGQDAFAKFYMYAALLHMATIRDEGRNFDQVLPKRNPVLGARKLINIGLLTPEFTEQAGMFQQGFEPAAQNKLHVAQKIVMAYFRRGQLADIMFIINKMLMHLSDNPPAPTDSRNKDIYDDINFVEKQAALLQFVQVAADLSNKAQKAIDSGMYATASGAVALAGAIVLVASLLSVGSFLIGVGAAMTLGGGYGCYSLASQAHTLVKELKYHGRGDIKAATIEMNRSFGSKAKIMASSAYKDFILRAVAKPIFFCGVTVKEQLAASSEQLDAVQVKRDALTEKLQGFRVF